MEVSDEITLERRPEGRDIAGHVDRQVISFPRHGNSTHQALEWEFACCIQREQGDQCGWGGVNKKEVIRDKQGNNGRVSSGRPH